MTEALDPSDEQWLVLDLLMRARQKGVHRINRKELLYSAAIPQGVAVRLTWAMLSMPSKLVTWHGQHDVEITAEGIRAYNLRFGKKSQDATPSRIADTVICLPGPGGYTN